MAARVQMPQLGATMTEGRLVKWLAAEGQQVRKGQPIAEIETDKIVAEVEAPEDGVLARTIAKPDDLVEVTGLLGWIAAPGETISREPEGEQPLQPEPPGVALRPALAESMRPSRVGRRVRASPRGRRLARENRIDLRQVTGTGPGGRITGQDVEAYIEALTEPPIASSPEPAAHRVVPLSGVRGLIAQRMADSARTSAAVTLFAEADATLLVRLRAQLGEALESPLGYDEFIIKIAAHALGEVPYMNARLTEEGRHELGEIHVGFAVATKRGLLVPVIRNADQKGLELIAREFRELVSRARGGRLSPDDLSGGTFTITNLGMYDVQHFTPIINLPECAILGIGQIAPRPAVVDGRVVARDRVALSLTFDHRLVDGAPAARFLQRMVQLVEEPRLLLV
jgi:pyruvate dehydrogenase E2 component (dihydrolipoamide acetyltransferase)